MDIISKLCMWAFVVCHRGKAYPSGSEWPESKAGLKFKCENVETAFIHTSSSHVGGCAGLV